MLRRWTIALAATGLIALAAGCTSVSWRQAAAPSGEVFAFPGAEGHGRNTVGGRGGDVYEVTNLNDAGPGSLRAAVEAVGPRTVVFRVSGTIDLQSRLRIRNPFITIAGQTAPGDGITLKRYPLQIDADEVIIRFIRVRLGGESGDDTDALGGRYMRNVILDHVSASWSIDETLSLYHAENVTLQWSIISESLYESNHINGAHGYGGIWGGNHSSFHHNLIAHHSSRNPRFASGAGNTDFRNNVVYNWGYHSTYGGEMRQPNNPRFSSTNVNMVANYYKPGPATEPGPMSWRITTPWSRNGADDYGKWYIAENVMHGSPRVTQDNWDGGVVPQDDGLLDVVRAHEPWPALPITEHTAEQAYELVLAHAGANVPRRDPVDDRIVSEVRGGTATYEGAAYKREHRVADASIPSGIIDRESDVGGWPELRSTPAPDDSDHDGMSDAWELGMGLDPADPADRNRIAHNGYTMLEYYLHSLAWRPLDAIAP